MSAPRDRRALFSSFAYVVPLPSGLDVIRSRRPESLQCVFDEIRAELNTTLWQIHTPPEQRVLPPILVEVGGAR